MWRPLCPPCPHRLRAVRHEGNFRPRHQRARQLGCLCGIMGHLGHLHKPNHNLSSVVMQFISSKGAEWTFLGLFAACPKPSYFVAGQIDSISEKGDLEWDVWAGWEGEVRDGGPRAGQGDRMRENSGCAGIKGKRHSGP